MPTGLVGPVCILYTCPRRIPLDDPDLWVDNFHFANLPAFPEEPVLTMQKIYKHLQLAMDMAFHPGTLQSWKTEGETL